MKKLFFITLFLFVMETQSMSEFERIIAKTYGKQGEQWLADLPQLVEKLATKWGLSDLQSVENLYFNYVLTGFRGTQPIILKICLDLDETQEELYALQVLAGSSLVSVLEADAKVGALLLEQIMPGTTFHTTFLEQDEEATQILCDLMQAFPRIEARS
jgi:streptomycin 6-kinase